jgi:hypothetical protein
MGKKNFTEEQIAFGLGQAESGTSVAEIIRKLGISEQTFYRWQKRFAGLGIAELRRWHVPRAQLAVEWPPSFFEAASRREQCRPLGGGAGLGIWDGPLTVRENFR